MRRPREPRIGAATTPGIPRERSRVAPAVERSGGDPAVAAEVVRLSNWTALLTFATAFAVIAALVALPTAFSRESTFLARFGAMVPTVAAAIGFITVRRTRKMLRAVRAQAGGNGT